MSADSPRRDQRVKDPPRRKHRADIQGLRMLAVVGVIANHAVGWPVGGFVGVDVFFVISGFLITGALVGLSDRSAPSMIAEFYRRRIKRIVPAAFVVLVATVAASAVVLPVTRAQPIAIDAMAAALFVANWRFAIVGTDYFAIGLPPSPLQHFWSLSVEEQFYLVWPLIIVATVALVMRFAGPQRRDTALFIAALIMSAASLVWALYETANDDAFAYFSSFARAWELGVGAMLAIALGRGRSFIPPSLQAIAALLGTAGILASFLVVEASPGFPAPTGLLPVLSTALVIAAGTGAKGRYDAINFLLTNRVSQFVGDISYSLYLWHFPILVLGAAVLPAGSTRLVVAALAGTLTLSYLTYRSVEEPVRRSAWLTPEWRWDRRRIGLIGAGSAATLACVALTGLLLSRPPQTVAPEQVARSGCFGADYRRNGCDPSALSGKLAPALDEVAGDTGGAFFCWRARGRPLKPCTVGRDSEASKRVAIVGDSHAAMLMVAIKPELVRLNWSLDVYLGYGCQWRDRQESDCASEMPAVQERVESGDYDIIITTASRMTGKKAGTASTYSSAWKRAIARGSRVLAVADVPNVPEKALACAIRRGADSRTDDCEFPVSQAFEPADPLIEAVRETPGSRLVKTEDLYCYDEKCPAIVGGVIVYRDAASHITATYLKTVADELMARIERAAG